MPAASATSSTVVLSKPRSANSCSAMSSSSSRVVTAGRPCFTTPLLLSALSAVMLPGVVTAVTRLHHKERRMDENELVEETVEVVEESLVEDVSIDGMCGVY